MADKTKPTAKPAASKKAAGEKTLSQMIAETPNIFARCTLIRFYMDIARFMELKQNMASAAPGTEEDLVLAYVHCNYYAAQKHVKAYRNAIQEEEQEDTAEGETPADKPALAPDIDLISATTVYFFAVNPRIDPSAQDSLQPSDKKALADTFSDLDDFAHDNAEAIHDTDELLKTYIAFKYPIRLIQPTRPDTHRIGTANVNNSLFDPLFEYKDKTSIITGKNTETQQKIKTYVYINTHGADHLDGTDKRIHNALDTLWYEQDGNPNQGYCTLSDIVRATGLPNSEQARQEVLYRLHNMSLYEVRIDNREELQNKGNKYPSTLSDSMEGRIIAYQIVPVKVNGKVTDKGIEYLEPFLAKYSRQRKQETVVQIEVLQYPVHNSWAVIEISNYLIEYIAWQYNVFKNNRIQLAKLIQRNKPEDVQKIEDLRSKLSKPITIKFDTLYLKAGAKNRKQKQRARDNAFAILQYYQNNQLHHVEQVVKGSDRFLITPSGQKALTYEENDTDD